MNILQVKKILPSNQKQNIERARFTYSPLGKTLEKPTKTIEDQELKQVDALKSLESSVKQLPSMKDFISKARLSPEIIDEIERTVDRRKKQLIEVKWFTKKN